MKSKFPVQGEVPQNGERQGYEIWQPVSYMQQLFHDGKTYYLYSSGADGETEKLKRAYKFGFALIQLRSAFLYNFIKEYIPMGQNLQYLYIMTENEYYFASNGDEVEK